MDRIKGNEKQQFSHIIQAMGEESRVAQGLRQILTTVEKLQACGSRLYIHSRR